MFLRRLFVALAALVIVGAPACSRDSRAGDAGYRFNLDGRYASDLTVGDKTYTGSVDLATVSGGALSGTMNITAPITITATLTGLVTSDSINFGGPYRTPDCTGIMRGRGRIADGGRSAWGSLSIDDGCVGAMAGKFRLER